MRTKFSLKNVFAILVLGLFAWGLYFLAGKWNETRILKQMIERLTAETRVAEVLVTQTGPQGTTIKFLEYDSLGEPLKPKYFTFKGNVIQFQSLVIRFKNKFVETGDRLKGKSASIFLKAFVLEHPETQVMTITEANEIPEGYKIPGLTSAFEKRLWGKFWQYALYPKLRDREGIKSVQLEAPGSVFVPGTLYTLKIEHRGGLRIDTQKIPEILKGEKL